MKPCVQVLVSYTLLEPYIPRSDNHSVDTYFGASCTRTFFTVSDSLEPAESAQLALRKREGDLQIRVLEALGYTSSGFASDSYSYPPSCHLLVSPRRKGLLNVYVSITYIDNVIATPHRRHEAREGFSQTGA